MAFPVIAGSQLSGEGASVNTHDVTLPASVAAGDLIIAWIFKDGNSTFAWPSPWVELADQTISTVACMTIGYLIASGGETTVAVTATGTAERSTHIAIRITGWHGTTPPAISTVATGASTTPNPGSLNPAAWDVEDTLWIASYGIDSGVPSAYPLPDNNISSGASPTSAAYGGICSDELAQASLDPGTFTNSTSDNWAAYTIAVRPASGTGVTVTPSPVTVPLVIPAPTLQVGRVVTPSPVAVPLILPAPTLQVGALVTPDPLTIPLVLPAVSVSTAGDTVVTPDPLVIPLALPTPTIGAGVLVTPAPLTVPLFLPAPTISAGVLLTPAPLVIPLVIPAVTVVSGTGVSPSPLVIPLVIPADTLGVDRILTPSPLVIPLVLPAPTVLAAGTGITMRRVHDIQYHVVIYSPAANGGPGTAKYELDSDALNLVWQQALNYPAQAAIGLARFNPKLADLDYMKDHIKIFREDDKGLKTVFAGKLVKPNETARDSLIYAWDYAAFLQLSRTGFRVLYPEKTIKEIVDAEWALAKNVDKSPFEFVTTGTTQAPLALDGTTEIKTNSQFGVIDFDRLFLFFALAEMSMANTSNTVVFEITRDTPHTFNFWKNRSTQRTGYHFSFPGNLIDYDLEDGHDQIRNDLATIILDPTTGAQVEYALTDTTSKDEFRRLQAAVAIRTLYGISSGTTETDQQKAALARMLTVGTSIPSVYTLFPRQGEITPFDGWDLGDTMRVTIMKPDRTTETDGYRRVTGVAGAWTPFAGELLQLFVR